MPIRFRPAEAGDRPRLLDLFAAAFRSQADPADWAWKYDQNPHQATSVVAEDAGRLVGFFGAVGTRYRGASGDLPGTSSVDVMTHPEARALGKTALFKELGNAFRTINAEAGIPFDFGFPHERARKIEERLLGCITIERAGHLVRDLPAAASIRSTPSSKRGGPFGPEHEALAEILHARTGWRTDRSADVLNWRFARPGVAYDVFQQPGPAGGTRGYAVVRHVQHRALLVDLQVADETGPDLVELVESVAAALGPGTTRLEIRVPQTGTLAARLRQELGFRGEESDTHFFVRPFDPAFDLMSAARSFDYRFADHDVF